MNSYFQSFDNITFSDLWSTKEDFIKTYEEIGLPQDEVNTDTLGLVYILLLGRFADSVIKPYNVNGGFKVRFMTRVWQYAPAWKKELEIQKKLRSLSIEDGSEIYIGGSAIYNTALNPGTNPGTQTLEELDFINSQNVTKYKKSKLEGLAMLTDLLKNDVTNQFLSRFDDLFKTIVYSGRELLYQNYNEGEQQ